MIFLIRHSESETNAGLPTSHPGCGGLTSQGEEQAKRIFDYLKYYPLGLIVTSPYKRTKLTAEPTAFVFNNTLKRSIVEDEWSVQEFTYLSPERLGYSTLKDRKPEVEKYWKEANPYSPDGPGAESFCEFIERVRKFLDRLKVAEDTYENIAVFSHEQFMDAVRWLIDFNPVEISSRTMREFRIYLNDHHIPNGAIIQLKFSRHENRCRYKLITEHLEEHARVAAD